MSAVAFLFPGQGSQAPGMGRELAAAFEESRQVFDAADRVLGFPLSQLCFEGAAEDLARTENTQPAVLTVAIAALRALERRGVRPAAAAGHSLGEYAAHVAAGTLRFEDALPAVRTRGRLMQQAVPEGLGAMAAILGLDASAVIELCARAADGQVVEAVNFNEPAQTVVAGHAPAVERLIELARATGARRAVRLAVSAPFHSTLMRPAAEGLAPVLERIEFGTPRFPVYANVDARPTADGAAARAALVRQVASPVRWSELVTALGARGFETFVEVGPGSVLAGMVRRILPAAETFGVADPAGVERAAAALGRAA